MKCGIFNRNQTIKTCSTFFWDHVDLCKVSVPRAKHHETETKIDFAKKGDKIYRPIRRPLDRPPMGPEPGTLLRI